MARALAVVGDHWTLLVLREAFYGVRRFDEMRAHLEVSRAVLTARLAALVEHGVLERVPYRASGQRTRFEYQLTRKGEDLLTVLVALMQWGDDHLPQPERGRPSRLVHATTGAEVRARLVEEGGRPVRHASDLRVIMWPDHPARTRCCE